MTRKERRLDERTLLQKLHSQRGTISAHDSQHMYDGCKRGWSDDRRRRDHLREEEKTSLEGGEGEGETVTSC